MLAVEKLVFGRLASRALLRLREKVRLALCALLLSAGAAPSKGEMVVTAEDKKHWAFLPLAVANPASANQSAGSAAIDGFWLAALARKNLAPVGEAPAERLVRRLYFDLTGLPPTPKEVETFVQDPSARAYGELVDRLLASPRFGERWARHWLDVVRYADSKGYERDGDTPTAHHYRDFVIRAFNDDLPFDTFTRWQLAADELAPDNFAAKPATAFIALGPMMETDTKLKDELARYRYAELDDMLGTTGSAFLGLTIGCARCHDHKYDPIPMRDYYGMLSAFVQTRRAEAPLAPRAEIEARKKADTEISAALEKLREERYQWVTAAKDPLRKQLRDRKVDALPISQEQKDLLKSGAATGPAKELSDKFGKELYVEDAEFRATFSPEQREKWDQLNRAFAETEARKPKPVPVALSVVDQSATPQKNWLMKRGDATKPGEEVDFGVLSVLGGGQSAADYLAAARQAAPAPASSTFQRAALAEWLVDTQAGAGALLARVIVNRLWQHHFGEGLVRTPNDFGSQGEKPTHPELLDWLARELVRNGWRLKPIHKMIVMSQAYRLDTTFDAAKASADVENRLLWRRRPQRLDSEILRDAILAVSGCLNTNMFGPGVKAPIPPEAMVSFNLREPYPNNAVDGPETWRRSVYLFVKRSVRQPLLELFDGADPNASCGRRIPTTVAPQALAMLNDRFIRARALDFAKRLVAQAEGGREREVSAGLALALSRPPKRAELERGLDFVTSREASRAARKEPGAHESALADFCQALFGLNEFAYVD